MSVSSKEKPKVQIFPLCAKTAFSDFQILFHFIYYSNVNLGVNLVWLTAARGLLEL